MQQQGMPEPTIEMSLREHLLAAGAGQSSVPVTPGHQSSHHDHNIDPAIAGTGFSMSAADDSGHLSEGRKGRRELSTSKRAAQNRAAQRAFRQRKEEYIKSLKDQVKEYEQLSETYKAVQAENYQLRDYIISLQSRLLESHAQIPPPPENIDLSRPNQILDQHGANASSSSAPTATMTPVAITQLQQAAAQASAHEASSGDSADYKHDTNGL